MSTFTASEFTSEAKGIHAGVVSKSSKLSVTVTATVCSTWLLAKIPHGAVILDYLFFADDGGTASQIWKLGIRTPLVGSSGTATSTVTKSALLTTGLSSTDGNVTARGDGRLLPVKVSISDNVSTRFAWIEARNVLDICQSAVLTFTVFYTMDGS